VIVTLPTAFFLDLDDTILDDSGSAVACWREACVTHTAGRSDVAADTLAAAIERVRAWYWADAHRHREGRLDLNLARREVTTLALRECGVEDETLARQIADRYGALRDARIQPIDGAIETVRWLRERGTKLALLTNGNAQGQRRKVELFQLAPHFDIVLIEGELGFGKPDPRVYERALDALRAAPADTWMVGDNLEWDVAAPQRLGITGIWIDRHGEGVPEHRDVRPDHVIRSLSGLRTLGENPRSS
jgi:putative hydrolase of the HAD superfamily